MSTTNSQEEEEYELGYELYNGQQQTFEAMGLCWDDLLYGSGDKSVPSDGNSDWCELSGEDCENIEGDDEFGDEDADEDIDLKPHDTKKKVMVANGSDDSNDNHTDTDINDSDINHTDNVMDDNGSNDNDSGSVSLRVMSDESDCNVNEKKNDKKRKRDIDDAMMGIDIEIKKRKLYINIIDEEWEKSDKESAKNGG
eukprot:546665_1